MWKNVAHFWNWKVCNWATRSVTFNRVVWDFEKFVIGRCLKTNLSKILAWLPVSTNFNRKTVHKSFFFFLECMTLWDFLWTFHHREIVGWNMKEKLDRQRETTIRGWMKEWKRERNYTAHLIIGDWRAYLDASRRFGTLHRNKISRLHGKTEESCCNGPYQVFNYKIAMKNSIMFQLPKYNVEPIRKSKKPLSDSFCIQKMVQYWILLGLNLVVVKGIQIWNLKMFYFESTWMYTRPLFSVWIT